MVISCQQNTGWHFHLKALFYFNNLKRKKASKHNTQNKQQVPRVVFYRIAEILAFRNFGNRTNVFKNRRHSKLFLAGKQQNRYNRTN
jgi:hypothetical protein